VYFERSDGAYIYDVDGNAYLDLDGGHSSLPLGNNHPAVREAIERQLACGTYLKGPYPAALELAEELCGRIPSVEQVLFTDSGAKATNFAVRLARVHTGRTRFAKMGGGFHGSWDGALFGLPGRYADTEGDQPSPGVPASARQDIVLLGFNDLAGCEQLIRRHGPTLAAVVVEPVLGDGFIVALPGFLEGIRSLCDEYGIVLVYDEMVSLGTAYGGAQERLGVLPDLTAMGKIIGGGMPIGGIGGRAALFEHVDGARTANQPLFGATFGGHPLSLVAGAAQLKLLTPEVYRYLDVLGERARDGIAAVAARHRVPLTASGLGRFVALHWTGQPVTTHEAHRGCDNAVLGWLCSELLARGFTSSKGVRFNISAAVTTSEIDAFVAAVDSIVGEGKAAGRWPSA
jgi:glutamate-1-semialdehyde 2,1-aminomutase